jgi:hypothetical protein
MRRVSALRASPVVLLAGLALLVAAPAMAGAGAPLRAPLAGVVLEDAAGHPWDLDALVGQPVLVVLADRSASAKAVAWGRAIGRARPGEVALWASPGKVATLSLADLRAVPGFARGVARWIIAQMVGEHAGEKGPPLLLDWDGAVAGRVDAEEGVPNVRLYAADGSLVLRDSGDPAPEKVARLATAIDGVVSGAAPPAGAASPPGTGDARP